MKKVIICLLIILLIAAIGIGGWYLWDLLQKEKNRTDELEKKIESIIESREDDTSKKVETESMTESEALKIAEKTYENAYYAVNSSDSGAYVSENDKYIVNVDKLKKHFTEKAIKKIVSISYYSKDGDEYYIESGKFVDFIPGIFGLTDQEMRPLKIVSYSDNKISATGQIIDGRWSSDEEPLKIEFVKEDDTWLVDDFE